MSESDVQAIAQLFTKAGHEPCVSAGNDGSGQPAVLHDVIDELVCGVDGRGFSPCRDKVCHLGSPVCHREYAVVDAPISGDPWQRYDPVLSDCLPFLHWQRHALHASLGSVMIGFRMLTNVAR